MKNKIKFDDESFNEKVRNILDHDNDTKKWNEELLIKSLILFPIIIFSIGLFIVNRPESLTEIIFVLFYPLILILMGVIILFLMTRNLN